MRIGQGYDVHQLAKGEELWIGGILFDSEYGAVGHSDADVLLHAISDALLGSLSLGDIGIHFPNTDQSIKGIDSKVILKKAHDLIKEKGYQICNIDSTLILERPKISGRLKEIIESIAGVLDIEASQVSVKATTSEKLGFVGEGKGITAHATVLIEKA